MSSNLSNIVTIDECIKNDLKLGRLLVLLISKQWPRNLKITSPRRWKVRQLLSWRMITLNCKLPCHITHMLSLPNTNNHCSSINHNISTNSLHRLKLPIINSLLRTTETKGRKNINRGNRKEGLIQFLCPTINYSLNCSITRWFNSENYGLLQYLFF